MTAVDPTVTPPTTVEIQAAHRELVTRIRETPTQEWLAHRLAPRLPTGTRVHLKLELFQHTGSFKARGALCVMQALDAAQRARGVTAVSAGNHAIAAAWAARSAGVSAKVVMIGTANPRRIELTKSFGAEVVMAGDAKEAFATADRLVADEGRVMIHPFEGRLTSLGTATVGAELMEQATALDAVIVPIGGGGLIAGVAAAVKLANPACEVFGVEPTGADSMHRSFAAGEPRPIERPATIADSLGAPYAMPWSFESARRNVDGLVLVDDEQLRAAMRLTFLDAKLAVEPAGAAALAALLGPLRDHLAGKHVGLVVCGSNIDVESYTRLLSA
jgi:threonine dehydratase